MSTRDELEKLVRDLLEEGYRSGSCKDEWVRAWAIAIECVVAGAEYTDYLVEECHNHKGDDNEEG